VLDAIRICQSLKIPVISVNAGADMSKELGLLQHVGQMEYNAGYGAGLRLGQEGIKEAYCLNHQVGNIVLDERCRYVAFTSLVGMKTLSFSMQNFGIVVLEMRLLQSILVSFTVA
jgi:hypothetical protein